MLFYMPNTNLNSEIQNHIPTLRKKWSKLRENRILRHILENVRF